MKKKKNKTKETREDENKGSLKDTMMKSLEPKKEEDERKGPRHYRMTKINGEA